MEEVAAEAEFSKGTLYTYFASKNELFAQLSDKLVDRVEREFKNISSSTRDGQSMVAELLRSWVALSSDNARALQPATGPERRGDLLSLAAPGDSLPLLVDHLARAIRRGQVDGSVLRQGDATMLAYQLSAAVMGALTCSSPVPPTSERQPSACTQDELVNGLVELLTTGLGAAS